MKTSFESTSFYPDLGDHANEAYSEGGEVIVYLGYENTETSEIKDGNVTLEFRGKDKYGGTISIELSKEQAEFLADSLASFAKRVKSI